MSMVVEPDRELLGEQSVLKPSCGCLGTCGRVRLSAARWFRLSRSLALTSWLNRLRGRKAHVLA